MINKIMGLFGPLPSPAPEIAEICDFINLRFFLNIENPDIRIAYEYPDLGTEFWKNRVSTILHWTQTITLIAMRRGDGLIRAEKNDLFLPSYLCTVPAARRCEPLYLSRNMGTSVQMLENYYGHANETIDRSARKRFNRS